VAQAAAGAAFTCVGALQEQGWRREWIYTVRSGSDAETCCGVLGRCRSVGWPQHLCGVLQRPLKQQLQRLGALQERSVASEAAVATSRSFAGTSCGSSRSRGSVHLCGNVTGAVSAVQERCWSVLWDVLLAGAAAVAASGNVAGAFCGGILWPRTEVPGESPERPKLKVPKPGTKNYI